MKLLKNNTIHFIVIEKELFTKVKKLVEHHNKTAFGYKEKLKMDCMVFFLNLVDRKALEYKDKLTKGHVRLRMDFLQKYFHDIGRHIDFLRKHAIISRIGYEKGKYSFGYKIKEKNRPKGKKIKFIKEEFLNFTTRKKLSKLTSKVRSKVNRNTPHLYKWLFDTRLTVNYNEAIDHIANSKIRDNRKCQWALSIAQIHHKQMFCNREGKDNRLHTNHTSIPSVLRQFINFDDSYLVSLDLKSSQPFLLAGLLNLIISRNSENLNQLLGSTIDRNLKKQISDSLSNMMAETMKIPEYRDVQVFIDTVVQNDFYDYISERYTADFKHRIKDRKGYSDKFYDENKDCKIEKRFHTLRAFTKQVVMEYLYGSPTSQEHRIMEIRRIMPDYVNKVVDTFKKVEKSHFPIFLQNIEAHFFLDVITKELAKEYPDMYMHTVHDSIVVPQGYEEVVSEKIKGVLRDFFGIEPQVSIEYYGDSEQNLLAA